MYVHTRESYNHHIGDYLIGTPFLHTVDSAHTPEEPARIITRIIDTLAMVG